MSEEELVIEPYFQSPAACYDYDPRAPAVARFRGRWWRGRKQMFLCSGEPPVLGRGLQG